jgi:Flp pilus assembly pilin Flp
MGMPFRQPVLDVDFSQPSIDGGRCARRTAGVPASNRPNRARSIVMTLLRRLHALALVRDTRGLSTVEYVIILALIAAFAVTAWNSFGKEIKQYVEGSSGEIRENMPTFVKGD